MKIFLLVEEGDVVGAFSTAERAEAHKVEWLKAWPESGIHAVSRNLNEFDGWVATKVFHAKRTNKQGSVTMWQSWCLMHPNDHVEESIRTRIDDTTDVYHGKSTTSSENAVELMRRAYTTIPIVESSSKIHP